MSEKRPSKKQRELLVFIENFIKTTGYGPSYREIMRGLDYKSVSTVAVHVDGLITRGLLRKKDNSARSLEIVANEAPENPEKVHIDWLKKQIKKHQADETLGRDEVETLTKALKILDKSES